MSWFELAVLSLAAARLTWMILFDAGPMRVLDRVRHRLDVYESYQRGTIQHFMNCPWCISLWAGLVMCLGYVASPRVALAISVPLAVSFIAAFMVNQAREV